MSPEERERSYEHYKQWQINKNRYKHECVAYVLIVGVVALFVLKHWKELSIGLVVIIVAGCIYLLAMLIRKYIQIQQKTAEIKKIAEEVGGTDIVIDHEKGKVSFSVPAENADAVISDIEKNMGNSKYKLKVSRVQNPDNE